MTIKKLPLFIDKTYESIYGNFGVRFGALFLDGLLLAPITFGMLIYNSMELNNYYISLLVFQIVYLAYSIYLPVRYGATPGKRIMNLTILKIDGSPIGYRESFLKVLPVIVVSLFGFVIQLYLHSQADATTFNKLPWKEQNAYLQSFGPYLNYLQLAIVYIYYISNLIVFLKNERKRSIGDQIAGTVVVYTKFLDKIKALENPID